MHVEKPVFHGPRRSRGPRCEQPNRARRHCPHLAGGGRVRFGGPPPVPALTETVASSGQVKTGPPSFLAGISRSNDLLGDMGGLRTLLSRYGMTLSLQETSELLGNVSGGIRPGSSTTA